MKTYQLFLTVLCCFALSSCDKEVPNVAPDCSVIKPRMSEKFGIGSKVEFIINATDTDGSIKMVEIFNGSELIVAMHSMPYIYSWDTKGQTAGQCVLTIKVTDDDDEVITKSVNVEFVDAPTVSFNKVRFISPDQVEFSLAVEDLVGDMEEAGVVASATDEVLTLSQYDFAATFSNITKKGTYTVSSSKFPVGTPLYYRAFAVSEYGTSLSSSIICPYLMDKEDFNTNNRDWYEVLEDDGYGYSYSILIENGFYKLRYTNPNRLISVWNTMDVEKAKNQEVMANFKFNRSDSYSYADIGIVYNISSSVRRYFRIAENKYYTIANLINNEWSVVKAWTSSNYIKSDGNNEVKIYKFARNNSTVEYYFYINGYKVHSYTTEVPDQLNSIGFSISDGEVWVDDLSVFSLESEDAEPANVGMKMKSSFSSFDKIGFVKTTYKPGR
jgi:hypothetical protein